MSRLTQYQTFLKQWKQIAGSTSNEKQLSFQNKFTQFQIEYKKYKKANELISLTQAPSYNIFRILGVYYDELKYSAFLANLLDPNENHGQGILFLQSFLEYCLDQYKNFPQIPTDLLKGRWNVIQEQWVGNGRIDIAVINWELGYMFVIENKVKASEQDQQLARYWRWMDTYKKECPSQALVFLTISGTEAASSGGHPFFRLSYHEDIPAWLNKLLPKIKAQGVREVVKQYKDIVFSLYSRRTL
jgi:hypothetical protein